MLNYSLNRAYQRIPARDRHFADQLIRYYLNTVRCIEQTEMIVDGVLGRARRDELALEQEVNGVLGFAMRLVE